MRPLTRTFEWCEDAKCGSQKNHFRLLARKFAYCLFHFVTLQDLARTFPTHELFQPNGIAIPGLQRVLRAFCWRFPAMGFALVAPLSQDPLWGLAELLLSCHHVLLMKHTCISTVSCCCDDGHPLPPPRYCQSLNYIAGLFLILMSEEEAFWMLSTLVEDILPGQFYSTSLTGLRVEQGFPPLLSHGELCGYSIADPIQFLSSCAEVFNRLLELKLPDLARHFEELGVNTSMFVCSWFLRLYMDVLPLQVCS